MANNIWYTMNEGSRLIPADGVCGATRIVEAPVFPCETHKTGRCKVCAECRKYDRWCRRKGRS